MLGLRKESRVQWKITTIMLFAFFVLELLPPTILAQACDPESRDPSQYVQRDAPEFGNEWVPAHCYNYNVRTSRDIRFIIIHTTAADNAQSTKNWFQNGAQMTSTCGPTINNDYCRTSTHFLVDVDGTITQFVEGKNAPNHVLSYNHNSIGIEHVGTHQVPEWSGPTQQMYEASAMLIRYLAVKYDLTLTRTGFREIVKGHDEVQRGKSDPGDKWDWDLYSKLGHDAHAVYQSSFPIVEPGETVTLSFEMQNTGFLTWVPELPYKLVNTGGERFGLPSPVSLQQAIPPNAALRVDLPPFAAPQEAGTYQTRWQIVYDNGSDGIESVGPEIGYVITVLPEGTSPGLIDAIRQIIDEAKQEAEESLEAYLTRLQRAIEERIQEVIDKAIPPEIRCLLGLSFIFSNSMAFGLWKRKKR